MRFISVSILLFLIPLGLSADQVSVAFGKEKPPFVFGLDKHGLEIDIFREALAFAGHTLSVNHFDNGALVDAVVRERVDAAATARSEDPELCRVERFIQFENVAISLADRNYRIEAVSDLAGYRVLAWERAYQDLGDEFFQLFAPELRENRIYLEHHSQEAQVKMFWLDRADVLVIDKVIFEWYRRQLKPRFQSHREVQFHPVFSSPTYYPALFRDETLCEEFRAGLAKLKSSGRYQELYESYIK